MSRPIENWNERARRQLSRGDRAADVLRNGMGSWTFVGAFLAIMAVWAIANVAGPAWDPYPFILLNLFLSMIAGLQGAILLIAAKRQDAITAALAQHDYETNRAAKVEIEELTRLAREQGDLLARLSRLQPVGALAPAGDASDVHDDRRDHEERTRR